MITLSRASQGVSGEALLATVKSTPPVAVVGAGLAGIDLQHWVLIATLVYTLLQTALLIPKAVKLVKGWLGG